MLKQKVKPQPLKRKPQESGPACIDRERETGSRSARPLDPPPTPQQSVKPFSNFGKPPFTARQSTFFCRVGSSVCPQFSGPPVHSLLPYWQNPMHSTSMPPPAIIFALNHEPPSVSLVTLLSAPENGPCRQSSCLPAPCPLDIPRFYRLLLGCMRPSHLDQPVLHT